MQAGRRRATLAVTALVVMATCVASFSGVTAGSVAAGAPRLLGPPLSVTGTPGDGSVTVRWTAPRTVAGEPVTGYVVQRRQGTSWRRVARTNARKRSVRATGLANGTPATFRVVAESAEGLGTPSRAVTATPRTTPSAPRSVTADDRHDGARVAWLPPSSTGGAPITGYVIQASQDGGAFQTVGTAGATATSKTVTGLQNGRSYQLRVAAVNDAGRGTFSMATVAMILPSVLSIDASDTHTCAVTTGRSVVCWGRNQFGNLGDGTTTDRHTPVTVSGLTGVVSVSVGDDFTCAVKTNGTAWCWGSFIGDALGASYATIQPTPVQVPGISDATSVDAHSFQGACVIRTTGQVTCWGVNSDGQFGTGDEGDIVDGVPPSDAVGLGDATRLAAGTAHTCVIRSGGSVLCWGLRSDGQTGTGVSSHPYLSPETALAPSGLDGVTVTDVTTGGFHTCLMEEEGIFYCAGSDSSGQLGDGTAGGTSGSFTAIAGLSGTDIDAGESTTCAVTTAGGVSCWGAGHTASPTAISGLSGAASISVGSQHSCVVLDDGTPRCWGENQFGQLGNGGTTDSTTPVRPTGL